MTEKLRNQVNPTCKDCPEDKQWKECPEPNMILNGEGRLVEEEPRKSLKDTHPLNKPLETVTLGDILRHALKYIPAGFMMLLIFFYLKINKYPSPETLSLALVQSAKLAIEIALLVTVSTAAPVILKKRFRLPEKVITAITLILGLIILYHFRDIKV